MPLHRANNVQAEKRSKVTLEHLNAMRQRRARLRNLSSIYNDLTDDAPEKKGAIILESLFRRGMIGRVVTLEQLDGLLSNEEFDYATSALSDLIDKKIAHNGYVLADVKKNFNEKSFQERMSYLNRRQLRSQEYRGIPAVKV